MRYIVSLFFNLDVCHDYCVNFSYQWKSCTLAPKVFSLIRTRITYKYHHTSPYSHLYQLFLTKSSTHIAVNLHQTICMPPYPYHPHTLGVRGLFYPWRLVINGFYNVFHSWTLSTTGVIQLASLLYVPTWPASPYHFVLYLASLRHNVLM